MDFIPLFFLQYNVNAPKYSPKKISFHKTPTGEGGHRFTKLFCKIDFFLKDGFPKYDNMITVVLAPVGQMLVFRGPQHHILILWTSGELV